MNMKFTKRKPISLGVILKKEFMEPYGLTLVDLAKAMGVTKQTVDLLLQDRDELTIDMAILLAKVFNNTPQFWLNISIDNQLWRDLHDSRLCTTLFH